MKFGRKKIAGALLIALSIPLVACEYEVETVNVETNLPTINQSQIQGNKLELSKEIEGFTFKTSYETGDYGLDRWRITDSKTIKMSAVVENLPEGTEVMIEHAHADLSLKATTAQVDGMSQDSMDDSYHGYSQDGFIVTEEYPYENIFAIEGFSKDIIEGWSFYNGSYGNSRISSHRLTEENLLNSGVYANKLQIVYDLLIKHKGEEKYHTKSVVDELLIPVVPVIKDAEQTKEKAE